MGKTKIEWADKSLNFYTWSCNKVSEGCKNCYMMAFANRLNKPNPVGIPSWRETALKEYAKLKSGEVVFVNSMSDTYHEGVPIEWIQRIHNLIASKPDVIFLLLTKRPHIALKYSSELVWPDNLWIGTSVELRKYFYRIHTLLEIPASGHFLSAEPLLENIASSPLFDQYLYHNIVDKNRIDWVILGAESGDNRREFNTQWARDMRDACVEADVPFMYKQGSHRKSGQERILDGRTWDETPFTW